MSNSLEKIIRPIVEGQIRGFAKEHPSIVAAVDWYPRNDKTMTFVNSLAKRIVRDLTCPTVQARLMAALLEVATGMQSDSSVDCKLHGEDGLLGNATEQAVP